MSGELQVLLPIEGLVDLAALRGRLEKDIAKAEKEIKGLTGRLANPNFEGKAPPEVVAECRANLAEAEAQAALARGRLRGWTDHRTFWIGRRPSQANRPSVSRTLKPWGRHGWQSC